MHSILIILLFSHYLNLHCRLQSSFFYLRDIEWNSSKSKQNDAGLVNKITRRNSDYHVCLLGFHHTRDQVRIKNLECLNRLRIRWIKLFHSSIAWVIKMEKIHYERQNKLEQIATEMYKNSVLVRSNRIQWTFHHVNKVFFEWF